MIERNFILLVERDNWQKDELLNLALLERLTQSTIKVIWEDPAGDIIYRLRKFERKLPWLPSSLKHINLRLLQLLYGLKHPSYYSYLYNRQKKSIYSRCETLKKTIKRYSIENRIIILARSSGGRISSLIADELNIKHLICLGYPFKHPHMPDEPERYSHLAKIKTPTLIIQGVNDVYGGIDIKDKYILSSNIKLEFIDACHDFNVNEQIVNQIAKKIEQAIGLY